MTKVEVKEPQINTAEVYTGLPVVRLTKEPIANKRGRKTLNGANELLKQMIPYVREGVDYSCFTVKGKQQARSWYNRARSLKMRMGTRSGPNETFNCFIKGEKV